jgi:hypothetical protein
MIERVTRQNQPVRLKCHRHHEGIERCDSDPAGWEPCLPRQKQVPVKLRFSVRGAANGIWFKREPRRLA